MNRYTHSPLLRVLILCALIFVGCSKDDNPVTQPNDPQTAVQTFTSSTGGKVETPSGDAIVVVPGVVPANQDGTPATVAFSIETNVALPKPLPAGATQVGGCVRFAPVGFLFNWPVRVLLKYPDGNDPASLFIMRFDAMNDAWSVVPASYADATAKKVGADVLELGEFVLVKLAGMGKSTGTDSQGGFEWGGEPGYYYALTVKSVVFKFPSQAAWYNLVGRVAGASGSGPTGGPLSPTHAMLPQGTYEIWISRTKPGTISEAPRTWTYTVPAQGTISGPLKYWGMGNTEGWTTLSLPGGGEWREGRPADWPTATKPMGTGELQATLSWVNTSSAYADIDLHLYGPNNMHVYWNDTRNEDESIELDRDWLTRVGNAVENIYSIKQMPKGSYTLKVRNLGPSTRTYAVRLIRLANVKTWTNTIASGEEHTVTTFTVN